MRNTEDQKLKVILAITKADWGGASRYVYDLAVHLSGRAEYDVAVFLGRGGRLRSELARANVRTIDLPTLGRDIRLIGEIRSFLRLVFLLRQERPHVFHANSSKMGGLGALAARCAGVRRIIFTAHGWAHAEDRPAHERAAIRLAHWVTIMLCHDVIAVSEAVRDHMLSHATKRKLAVIHNGIEEPDFFSRDEARRALGVTRPTLLVGTIAELHKNKGLAHLIRAIENTPEDAHLLIIGDGEERENLMRMARLIGQEHRITLAGFVPDAARYLPAFDIFVLPSVKEGLPYVLIEAGYAGLAVVATETGGVPEIVEDLKTGLLVTPKNEKELARAITQLAHDQDERKMLGLNLARHVKRNFVLKEQLARTRMLYASARTSPSTPSTSSPSTLPR